MHRLGCRASICRSLDLSGVYLKLVIPRYGAFEVGNSLCSSTLFRSLLSVKMPNMQATLLLALGTLTLASPVAELAQYKRAVIDPYAPIPALCPSTPLVRPATSINSNEAAYVKARKALADPALAAWLKKQGKFNTTSLPAVGMTSSGGGDRALLEAAGVTQAFDARDSSSSVAGIYQSLTYQAGLSGMP